jgi:hypothetical protein
MRLSDEPGATIRLLIGDGRADELGRMATGLVRQHHFTTDELEYLSQIFDYFAWLSSESEEEEARIDG